MNAHVHSQKPMFLTNGRIATPEKIIDNGFLIAEGGIIKEIGVHLTTPGECTFIDAGGRLVAPGFIDLHVQGMGGADVLDGTPEAVRIIKKQCVAYGVTGFLATTKYLGGEPNRHLAVAARETDEDSGGARLLGIYLEGPFISDKKLGMIPPRDVLPPSESKLHDILALCAGKLRIMTVAPEIPGSMDIIRGLLDNGVIPALGHTAATYEETIKGFEAGIRHATHFFNAMPSMHHREPGPIPAVLEEDKVTAEFICDGVHIHPAMLRLALRAMGKGRCALITDGMRPMGLPDGWYDYEGKKYSAKNGIALSEDGVLVGTATSMNAMIKNCIAFTGMEPVEAINAASLTPARALGIDNRKGSLEVRKDADMAILNEDFSVWKTIIGGREVYGAA